LRLLEGGVLKAKATDPFPLRLQTLHDALADVLREYNPDVVVVEELFSTYAHPRSALLLAQARGVLVSGCATVRRCGSFLYTQRSEAGSGR
jgi:crossover junction endodeoxyribonuclease RuvC